MEFNLVPLYSIPGLNDFIFTTKVLKGYTKAHKGIPYN